MGEALHMSILFSFFLAVADGWSSGHESNVNMFAALKHGVKMHSIRRSIRRYIRQLMPQAHLVVLMKIAWKMNCVR